VFQSQEPDIDVLIKAKYRISLSTDVNGQRSKDLVNYNLSLAS